MATASARSAAFGRNRVRWRRWPVWTLIILMAAVVLTYGVGQVFEPIGKRLATVPVAGTWFSQRGSGTPVNSQTKAPAKPASDSVLAAGMQALESRAAELGKREIDVAQREELLLAKESALRDQQNKLDQDRKGLESRSSQLKSELDQVDVVRAMKSTAAQQMFAAMTDDQVVRLLRYMKSDEVGRLLGGMDGKRAAIMLDCLGRSGVCLSKP